MIILEINKLFHEVIGLQSFQRSKYGGNIQIVVPFFVTVSLFGVASTSFVHFLLNVDDKILIALPSLQTVFAFPMIVLIYWYFLKFRADFYSLFDDIQAIIDESTWNFWAIYMFIAYINIYVKIYHQIDIGYHFVFEFNYDFVNRKLVVTNTIA